jgi:hypothetical protein
MDFISTAEDFRRLICLGTTAEDLRFEFKSKIDGWQAKDAKAKLGARREMCRDVAQFANTDGGYLVVGVSETTVAGRTVADAVVGVPDSTALKAWLEQAVTNHLVPSRFGQSVEVIDVDGASVVVVNVPPSRAVVAVWEGNSHTVQYVRRTSHGKDYMHPDDVERHMMNGLRAGQIALGSASNRATSEDVTINGGVWRRAPLPHNHIERYMPHSVRLGMVTSESFELRIADGGNSTNKIRVASVPYGLLREAWVGPDGKLNLMLDVRLVLDANVGFVFEPPGA